MSHIRLTDETIKLLAPKLQELATTVYDCIVEEYETDIAVSSIFTLSNFELHLLDSTGKENNTVKLPELTGEFCDNPEGCIYFNFYLDFVFPGLTSNTTQELNHFLDLANYCLNLEVNADKAWKNVIDVVPALHLGKIDYCYGFTMSADELKPIHIRCACCLIVDRDAVIYY